MPPTSGRRFHACSLIWSMCRLEWNPFRAARIRRSSGSSLQSSMRHESFMNSSFGQRDPDARGYYGAYGGRFVPETLVAPVEELERAYFAARADETFRTTLRKLLRDYVGRPTPIYEARRLSDALGGARIFFKREDLAHTGAHKINNALGQALLAQRMGKRRVIAETGAGQHGVATATVCALLGLECVVYMGVEDMRRQRPNVQRMELLGATVAPVEAGTGTLKEATSEAIRDWTANVEHTHYVIGSAVRQDDEGQIVEAHSVSAGLDYPGVGPEHAHLRDSGRARYVAVTDDDALDTFRRVTRLEGIIPAL